MNQKTKQSALSTSAFILAELFHEKQVVRKESKVNVKNSTSMRISHGNFRFFL
jgi:hypothetical protein